MRLEAERGCVDVAERALGPCFVSCCNCEAIDAIAVSCDFLQLIEVHAATVEKRRVSEFDMNLSLKRTAAKDAKDQPAKGPAWLANKLHPYGEVLEAGEIILGGSFTAPVPARAGDSFHVDFGPLGTISVRFA